MRVKLPLIVGCGGFNAAGRSSGLQSYRRMVFESLSDREKRDTLASLAAMMGLNPTDKEAILSGTLVRRIEANHFDVNAAPFGQPLQMNPSDGRAIEFVCARRELPKDLPSHWHTEEIENSRVRVRLLDSQMVNVSSPRSMPVQAAGQLPTGFDPAEHYRSMHHPRGLQMAVLGASDAVHSMGIDWQRIVDSVSPDDIAVYSSSVMSQLDERGFGGMLSARSSGRRVTSKQLALGLNTMPADFVNAYVLGNIGATGGVTGACATFLYNLRQAVEDIRSGRRKVVCVGSSEAPILPEIIDGYSAMSALATDENLRQLDGSDQVNYRRASRPFAENCGFTLAESSQYVILMADDLALSLGADVLGAVPGVYVNADGFKKSISAPGAGNYITMSKAVGLARTLLGDAAVQHRSFVHAHGSSTPQNRVTESRIFDRVAEAFDIKRWPVAAVKAYLGHSLSAASGDQLVATLGTFSQGILPGIKTIQDTAEDVYDERLKISSHDQDLGVENCEVAFLNSKGFGGNNATATVLSPLAVTRYFEKNYSQKELSLYRQKRESTRKASLDYAASVNAGNFSPIYQFGENLIDEEAIAITKEDLKLPGVSTAICLQDSEGFDAF